MISVMVTYTVNDNFIFNNKENIASFLEDFKSLHADSFKYTIYQQQDHGTFIHVSEYKNEVIQKELHNIPSFLAFQLQRDQNLKVKPVVEMVNVIGSSGNL